ncbi:MAG TPA: hypothetical protein DC047_08990 [Blastocatellia bacterium]|nr:hypothetical protein [Blastocatellia bacterium]
MSRYLKGVVVGSAVLLFVVALLIPEISAGSFQRKGLANTRRVDDLFNRNCARCHGADGRGQTPLGQLYKAPDFTDAEWWKSNPGKTSRRSMRSTIMRGKNVMPAFGKKLTKTEVNWLLNHMRAFRKSK